MAHAIRSTPQARLIRRACAACLTALLLSHGVTAHAAAARNCTLANTTPGPWNGLSGSAITITADTPPGTVLAKRGIAVRGEYQGQAVGPDIVRIHGAWTNGNGGQLGLHETMPTNIAGIGLRWSYRAENGEPSLPYDPTMERVLTSKLAESTSGGAFDTLTLQLYQELILTGPTPGGTVRNVPGAGASFYIDATRNGNVTRDCYQQASFGELLNINVPVANTCELQTANVIVRMGQYTPADFPALGRPSTRAPQQFSLQLSKCAAQARPKIQFSDANQPGNISRLLSINANPEEGVAAAQGLGLQLSRSLAGAESDIITFGPENDAGTPSFDMGSPLDGMVSMPLFAHYVRTGNVTAGHANAKAVFIITYP
ncbi:fimbrial protein [Chromobacterium haemolyticum]|uniref:fimbrial protein n=1 Tax=Chromobacterium haemolyticum TaxID=394935 RepID=UPI000DF00E1B|nr:fimbrial protein [Chromobacterium haemolyticum]